MLKFILLCLIGLSSSVFAVESLVVPDPMIPTSSRLVPSSEQQVQSVGGESGLVQVQINFKSLLAFGAPISRNLKLASSQLPNNTTGEPGTLKFTNPSHTQAHCENPPMASMGMTGTDGAIFQINLKPGVYAIASNDIWVGTLEVGASQAKVTPEPQKQILSAYGELAHKELVLSRPLIQKLPGLDVEGKISATETACKIKVDSKINLDAQYGEVGLQLKVTAEFPEQTVTEKKPDETLTRTIHAANVEVNVKEQHNLPYQSNSGAAGCAPSSPTGSLFSFSSRDSVQKESASVFSAKGKTLEIHVRTGVGRTCTAKIPLVE